MNTYTMHMGHTFNGGWEKTICFRQEKTDSGWVSKPVVVLDQSSILDYISKAEYVKALEREGR